MKAIKYVLMGVLLAGFSATANAQEEELNAAINAIKTNAADKGDLAKTAYKKNKKDAEALMKVARAYFEQKDTAGAILFANYANEAGKPKYQYAPAYLLLGDIEARLSTSTRRTPRATRSGQWYIVRSVPRRLPRSCRR